MRDPRPLSTRQKTALAPTQQQTLARSDIDVDVDAGLDAYTTSIQPDASMRDDSPPHHTDAFMTAVAGGDLGDETTIRLLKAKVRVMQEEINSLQSDLQQKDAAIADLQSRYLTQFHSVDSFHIRPLVHQVLRLKTLSSPEQTNP